MPEYLILRRRGDDWRTAEIVDLFLAAEGADPAVEVKKGYKGDGRYAILDWDSRIECDLAPGPVEVAAVEDAAARVAKAAEPPAEL